VDTPTGTCHVRIFSAEVAHGPHPGRRWNEEKSTMDLECTASEEARSSASSENPIAVMGSSVPEGAAPPSGPLPVLRGAALFSTVPPLEHGLGFDVVRCVRGPRGDC
jgi:hypothetical protein